VRIDPVIDDAAPHAGVFAAVVGQHAAVAQLRAAAARPVPAYLFLGPRGAGKRAAAGAFAALLLGGDESNDSEAAQRHRRLALAEQHPDLLVVVPEGRSLRRTEAETMILEGSRSPIEGRRKVIVADRFHTAEPEAAASLLKTIEEPPPTVVFVLLAEDLPPEHVTIASRCVEISFPPVSSAALHADLLRRGVAPELVDALVAAAQGNVDRAHLLATDESFAARRSAWVAAPGQLDGTGAAAAALVAGLRALIDDAELPLKARQATEVEALAAHEAEYGTRGSGRRVLEERHKREARLLREDELRLGLATLAAQYRDQLLVAHDPKPVVAALARITATVDALIRNPIEALLLEALFVDLPPI
jgi:DNA polymerase-3 subunit delta'